MATVARFQGGHMDGREMELDSRTPVQSYIETAMVLRPEWVCCPDHTHSGAE